MFRQLILGVTASLCLAMLSQPGQAGTILQYHHVAEDTPASTSVTPAQFAGHLQHLKEEGFKVVRMDELLRRARAGEDTRDVVAMTFDDGYASLMDSAMPMLAGYGWPAAVFVSTGAVGGDGMLDVEQLRALQGAGHLVLNHTRSHLHVVRAQAGESDADRVARVRADILAARTQLQQWLPQPVPDILAWPYGEHDVHTRQLARELGFTALAQVSGAVGPDTDWQAVPRIAVNSRYADWPGLRNKLRGLPMPVTVLSPADGVTGQARPVLALELAVPPATVTCFVDGQPSPVSVDSQPEPQRWQVRVRPSGNLDPGRHRVTCTRPVEENRFQWFSWLWMVRDRQGWYPEY